MDLRPPCWSPDEPCPNDCAQQLYRRVVNNDTPLHGPWAGWAMRGRDLVSPSKERISPERLRGLMFRQAAEDRLAAARARKMAKLPRQVVRVVVIDLALYRLHGVGAA